MLSSYLKQNKFYLSINCKRKTIKIPNFYFLIFFVLFSFFFYYFQEQFLLNVKHIVVGLIMSINSGGVASRISEGSVIHIGISEIEGRPISKINKNFKFYIIKNIIYQRSFWLNGELIFLM
jgi:hypothetical protein